MKQKHKLIYSSKDYSQFVQDDTNRAADGHPRLRASMKEYGWLPEHPAVVVPDSGKFRVKDGGHRISIAKELGLPVHYVVSENDDVSIPMINEAQKKWSLDNYISSFVRQGNKHYIRLANFAAETGLPCGIAAELLGNGSSAGRKIKAGDFKISTEDHARSVLAVVNLSSQVVKWGKQAKFIAAVSAVLRYTRASSKVLCDKIRSHGGMLIPQANTEGCIAMLENIYNYRNRDPLSIVLGVKQSLRQLRQENVEKATAARKAKQCANPS